MPDSCRRASPRLARSPSGRESSSGNGAVRDGGASARMTPILTSSSCALPNPCTHTLTSHSQRPIVSVVCATAPERFGCNISCIRTRCRPLRLLSYVAFNPRQSSRMLLTSVLFRVSTASRNVQLKIEILEALCSHCCTCDWAVFHRCTGSQRSKSLSSVRSPRWAWLGSQRNATCTVSSIKIDRGETRTKKSSGNLSGGPTCPL